MDGFTSGYGDDLFPKLNRDKFRLELRDLYDKTRQKNGKHGNGEGPESGGVREPRHPKPSSPGDAVRLEVPT